jgi:alkylhydroperoxidase family enzyme
VVTRPRISPLPPDERDERTRDLLSTLGPGDGGEVLNIFSTLARHPKLLRRWSGFGGVLLYGGRLPARDRELLILRTGWHCRAEYEWGQHVRIARDVGVTDAEIERIPKPPAGAGWSAPDEALLRAADELHENSVISDGTWKALATRYDEQQLIEVCMVVGQYHLVAFTLNSLGVQAEDGVAGFPEAPGAGE